MRLTRVDADNIVIKSLAKVYVSLESAVSSVTPQRRRGELVVRGDDDGRFQE